MTQSGVTQWIQCSRCLKWRNIPIDINFSTFFGKWECCLNKWNQMTCETPEVNIILYIRNIMKMVIEMKEY